jgi:hypothetical protein
MVARCRDKGLDAQVMDFSQLNFPAQSFDAVHAMNCLLHVPNVFFSWRTDDQIVQFARESFDIVDFHIAQADTQYRFQSLTLRRPMRNV